MVSGSAGVVFCNSSDIKGGHQRAFFSMREILEDSHVLKVLGSSRSGTITEA
jgi:hypothetical protein